MEDKIIRLTGKTLKAKNKLRNVATPTDLEVFVTIDNVNGR